MTKRNALKRVSALLICLVMVLSVFAFPKEAQAATYYKSLVYNSIVKSGSYYFKLESGAVYYSTSKTGTYKKAAFKGTVASACTDGNTIYAVENRNEGFARLSKYTISTKKLNALKKLYFGTYQDSPPGWSVTAVYGNAVFLTRSSFEEWSLKTYVYNTSNGSFRCEKKNCAIQSRSSKYLIAKNEYQSDVSAHKWTLYSTTTDGEMTALKTFGKYIFTAQFVGDKVFYGRYSNATMSKVSICCCDKNGANGVNYGTVSFGTGYSDMVVVTEFKSTYCKIYHNGTYYKYTYSTKKLTKL